MTKQRQSLITEACNFEHDGYYQVVDTRYRATVVAVCPEIIVMGTPASGACLMRLVVSFPP